LHNFTRLKKLQLYYSYVIRNNGLVQLTSEL